jgi:hypothetical protein
MSVEIVDSLLKNTEAEILKCKNDIFEATIKLVDISDKHDMIHTILKIQSKSFDRNKLTETLQHLSNEKNTAKQEIERLKLQLHQLKEKIQVQKKLLGF